MARRIDDTGFGGLRIIQETELFCYGVDAVILAEAALEEAEQAKRVCDLGSGNGIIPLILVRCTERPEIIGVELLEENVDLARESAEINGLGERVEFICQDVRDIPSISGGKSGKLGKGSFDVVTMNPPYIKASRGIVSDDDRQATARHETRGSLKDFMEAGEYLLKTGGSLFMINRPGRLVDMMGLGRTLGLEPKVLRLIAGKKGEKPALILVRFKKQGGENLEIPAEWAIREENGDYTPELIGVYERIKAKANNNGGTK